jgi:hypothetical protein
MIRILLDRSWVPSLSNKKWKSVSRPSYTIGSTRPEGNFFLNVILTPVVIVVSIINARNWKARRG